MYRHDVRVSRPGGKGTYTGADFAPAPDLVLYDGKADVQDHPQSVTHNRTGKPAPMFDAKLFFPLGTETDALFAKVDRPRPELKVRVRSPNGIVREGRIKDVRELDQTLMLRWMRAA